MDSQGLDPLSWLAERSADGSDATGYDPTGWAASIWILHAMFEAEDLPGGVTHDDVHRMELAAGVREPAKLGDLNLEELLSGAHVVGSALGRSEWPGPGWRRLSWIELGERLQTDPFAIDVPPCLRSFPYSSWPANIEPPGEGSLDREQFLRLLDHLAAVTPGGYDAGCTAFYAMCAVGEFERHTLYTKSLKELVDLYDDDEVLGSPSNIWPTTKEWFVYTDWDLWATKVSGSAELVERLAADAELETVSLPF